jgi:hypothetical protein
MYLTIFIQKLSFCISFSNQALSKKAFSKEGDSLEESWFERLLK